MRAAMLLLLSLPATTALAQAVPDGKTLFAQRCGLCHWAGGGGTWMLERRLGGDKALLEARTDLQPAYVRLVVRAGIASMPRFTRVDVSDTDLSAIANYLARPEPRQ